MATEPRKIHPYGERKYPLLVSSNGIPKKKLSLSLSIKCANDVHGHYYFGGDEEWQSVTSRFKIVLVEGYHRFEWV